jgi:hypothetical protein
MTKKDWQLIGAAATIGAALAEYRRSRRWTAVHTALVAIGAIATLATAN